MVSIEKGQQTSSQRGNAGDASKNTVQKEKGKQKAEEMVKWYTKCRKPKKRKLTNEFQKMKKARKKRRRKPVHHNYASCHDMRSIKIKEIMRGLRTFRKMPRTEDETRSRV
jgi:hypothetical protein